MPFRDADIVVEAHDQAVNEMAVRKQEYQSRLLAIEMMKEREPWKFTNLIPSLAGEMPAVQEAYTRYENAICSLMDEIVEYKCSYLSEEEANALRADQSSWIASARNNAGQVSAGANGSPTFDFYTKSLFDSYECRAREIIEML